jgi:hypothetical protein
MLRADITQVTQKEAFQLVVIDQHEHIGRYDAKTMPNTSLIRGVNCALSLKPSRQSVKWK